MKGDYHTNHRVPNQDLGDILHSHLNRDSNIASVSLRTKASWLHRRIWKYQADSELVMRCVAPVK